MKSIKELIKLLKTYLVAAIKQLNGQLEDVTGSHTDVPVTSNLNTELGKLVYADVINLFLLYTGKVGHHINLTKGYDFQSFQQDLLDNFQQSYIFDSIEDIKKNNGGVYFLGSEASYSSGLTPVDLAGSTSVIAVYLDEYSTNPDIIIREAKIPMKSYSAISICHNNRSTQYVLVNIAPILQKAEIREKVNKKKEEV